MATASTTYGWKPSGPNGGIGSLMSGDAGPVPLPGQPGGDFGPGGNLIDDMSVPLPGQPGGDFGPGGNLMEINDQLVERGATEAAHARALAAAREIDDRPSAPGGRYGTGIKALDAPKGAQYGPDGELTLEDLGSSGLSLTDQQYLAGAGEYYNPGNAAAKANASAWNAAMAPGAAAPATPETAPAAPAPDPYAGTPYNSGTPETGMTWKAPGFDYSNAGGVQAPAPTRPQPGYGPNPWRAGGQGLAGLMPASMTGPGAQAVRGRLEGIDSRARAGISGLQGLMGAPQGPRRPPSAPTVPSTPTFGDPGPGAGSHAGLMAPVTDMTRNAKRRLESGGYAIA